MTYRTMKTILTTIFLLATLGAQANIILSQSFTGGNVSEGDPTGHRFTGNYTAANLGDDVLGVAVHLNVTGGYVGDYYSYLVAPNGTIVTLLNQPGTDIYGSPASGFNNLILSSGSYGNIQDQNGTAGAALTGTYNAQGNLTDFGTVSTPGGAANGTWGLFFADLGSGGGTPDVTSWSLDITVVPEPVTVALAIFAGVAMVWTSRRWLRKTA